ncbi:hypothetical protein B0H13DRAFT_2384115 [Mycena leptocephala]|nr:hypothetical protein B0H13DRAFT_2384115 [Mycena leptocephala]
MGRALEVLQSLGPNSNSDVYVITAISKHLSPGKLQTTSSLLTRSLTQIAPTRTGFGGTPAALNAQIGWIDLEISMGARKSATKSITTLSLIAAAFSRLDTKRCSIPVHRTPCLNPNLLFNVFATIDILSNALQMGHRLPPSLPYLHERQHESDSEDSDSDTHAEFVADKVEGASIGFEKLLLSVLMVSLLVHSSAEPVITFSFLLLPTLFLPTGMVALGSLLTLIDELTSIMRELLGQTT